MDAIVFGHADDAHSKIQRFNESPDSDVGLVTNPKVITANEKVRLGSGRQIVLSGLTIEDGAEIEFGDAGSEIAIMDSVTFGDESFNTDVIKTKDKSRSITTTEVMDFIGAKLVPNTLVATGNIVVPANTTLVIEKDLNLGDFNLDLSAPGATMRFEQ